MNQIPTTAPSPTPPPGLSQTPPKSSCGKWACGCSIGCLVFLIILGVAGFFGAKALIGKVNEYVADFEAKGYVKQAGHLIEQMERVTEKTVYFGQVVKVMADSEEDMAIVAQMAEIHSHVEGNVYFKGQVIVIQPQAVIDGNLDVSAQSVTVYGTIKGELTGLYQVLDDKRAKAEPSGMPNAE